MKNYLKKIFAEFNKESNIKYFLSDDDVVYESKFGGTKPIADLKDVDYIKIGDYEASFMLEGKINGVFGKHYFISNEGVKRNDY